MGAGVVCNVGPEFTGEKQSNRNALMPIFEQIGGQ
jgi:hypothetical protein